MRYGSNEDAFDVLVLDRSEEVFNLWPLAVKKSGSDRNYRSLYSYFTRVFFLYRKSWPESNRNDHVVGNTLNLTHAHRIRHADVSSVVAPQMI